MATVSLDLNEMPYKVAADLVAGDTFPFPVQLKLNSTAVNLTSCTLALDGTGPGAAAMTAREITPTVAADGTFEAGLTSTETAQWSNGTARYQVELTAPAAHAQFSAGIVKTVLEFTLRVTSDLA